MAGEGASLTMDDASAHAWQSVAWNTCTLACARTKGSAAMIAAATINAAMRDWTETGFMGDCYPLSPMATGRWTVAAIRRPPPRKSHQARLPKQG